MVNELSKMDTTEQADESLCFQDPPPTGGYILSADKKTATNDNLHRNILKTSRPLRPNEVFKVRLKCLEESEREIFVLGIGLVTYSYGSPSYPTNFIDKYYPMEVWEPWKKENTGDTQTEKRGILYEYLVDKIKAYGSMCDPITVGYVFAVVRKGNGDVIFQMNGVDLGVAYSDAPENVLGYFETSGSVSSVEIV